MSSSPDPEPGTEPARARPGAPLWAKIFGGGLAILVVLVLVLLLSGGEHGPGRHSGGDSDTPTATEPGTHTGPPAGGHGPWDR